MSRLTRHDGTGGLAQVLEGGGGGGAHLHVRRCLEQRWLLAVRVEVHLECGEEEEEEVEGVRKEEEE